LRHIQGDILLRFGGRTTQVRGGNQPWLAQESLILRRFHLKNVEGGSCDSPGFQRLTQRCFVDQPATSGVHNISLGLEQA